MFWTAGGKKTFVDRVAVDDASRSDAMIYICMCVCVCVCVCIVQLKNAENTRDLICDGKNHLAFCWGKKRSGQKRALHPPQRTTEREREKRNGSADERETRDSF